MWEKHNPDYLIWCETWLDKDLKGINYEYEAHQTKYAKHQGILLIAKRDTTEKIFANDEPYFMTLKSKDSNSNFIIGAYFKENMKEIILNQIDTLIKRIRKTYINPDITMYWDLNPDKTFTAEKVEKKLGLKAANDNKTTITWEQRREKETKRSTLDYIFISADPIKFTRLDTYESDYYPIQLEINTLNSKKSPKMIKKLWRITTDNNITAAILEQKNWPSQSTTNIKQILYKEIYIRPTVKLQQKANTIFKDTTDWEKKKIDIKTACTESFRVFVKNLDVYRRTDSSKFYKVVNALIKYKPRSKLIKGIRTDNCIEVGVEKNYIIKQFFNKLFDDAPTYKGIESNGIFDYRLEIDRAIQQLSSKKAMGLDYIPDLLFKIKDSESIINRIRIHFEEYVRKWQAPIYFMYARLILFSKDGTDTSKFENTRPISVQPAVIKLFELWILHNLEKATESLKFNKLQRGFMKKWSTSTNISQLISRGLKLKQRRKNCKHETPAFIFFDFNKVYDSVPRDILIRKLMEFNIPWNIVKLIKNILKDFTLHYNNEIIIPKRGLVQGSVLSPLIFNLFINDLLNEFEANKITALGYADDIVCICENNEQIQLSCELMNRWSKMNRMTINPGKSGILRILARRGK